MQNPDIKENKANRGRGACQNPSGRFEEFSTSPVLEEDIEQSSVKTQIFKEFSKTILSSNDSPDIGMEATLNPYRGCEHGCIYCYARPNHEYMGLSAGLDFETKIFVKENAPELLRKKLESKNWVPKTITLSGVTDCYQPLEKSLEITRGCLRVLAAFRNPVLIITKNYLVTRDLDYLSELAKFNAISVKLSITTLDRHLARKMEPRTSTPERRLEAVSLLSKAGIPTGIMIGPVIPGLTDHEIPSILKASSEAGASSAHYTMLRLPYGVKDLFQAWLQEHYPDRAERVLNRVREVRGGKLYNSEFGTRMTGTGIYADHVAQMMDLYKRKYGLTKRTELSARSFRNPYKVQMDLFG